MTFLVGREEVPLRCLPGLLSLTFERVRPAPVGDYDSEDLALHSGIKDTRGVFLF